MIMWSQIQGAPASRGHAGRVSTPGSHVGEQATLVSDVPTCCSTAQPRSKYLQVRAILGTPPRITVVS